MLIKKEKSMAVQLISLTVFGVAMGFLESAVVVYLRELYYTEGFAFPLKPIILDKLSIEYFRETATLVMLVSLSTVAGRKFPERAAFFLYSFGMWDIFYYVWLKILLDWPSSLWTWDILFLIPVIWIGPVLAPLLCSLTMILIALSLLLFLQKGYAVKIRFYERVFLFLGTFAIFITFIWDYSILIIQGNFISRFWVLGSDPEFQNIISHYIPSNYNWPLFALGEAFIFLSVGLFYRRMRRETGRRNGAEGGI